MGDLADLRSCATGEMPALEIDRDALLLPIAEADRFRPFAPAQLAGQVLRFCGAAALFGFFERANGLWRQVTLCVCHGRAFFAGLCLI